MWTKAWTVTRNLAAVATVSALVAACAVNPATGKKQLSLISEEQEIAMGREADPQIVQQFGLYPSEALQNYVQGLGAELAARSERPELPWTFRVLDDPLVNAFALPGGFIYVTRGILAHLKSEAELVGVLGHEIGHVTARHSVNRLSKQQLAGLGLGIGMIVSPELRSMGDLAQQGLGLLFLKYSRDDERQSDDLGLRYALRTGYEASEIPGVFSMLERVSRASGGGKAPAWLATHPDPGQRRERLQAQIAELGGDVAGGKVNRRGYLQRLDGMVFGANPREGYFEGDRFFHPELAFSFDLPRGWKRQNQKQAVVAVSSKQDAMLQLTLAEQGDPASAVRAFLSQEGINGGRVESGNVNGLTAASALFEVPREQGGNIGGRVTAIRHGGNTFQILGFTLSDKYNGYRAAIEGTQSSFRRVTDRSVLDVQPARLDLVSLERGLTLEQFQRSYPSTVPIATLGLLNRVNPGQSIPANSLAKRVVGGPSN